MRTCFTFYTSRWPPLSVLCVFLSGDQWLIWKLLRLALTGDISATWWKSTIKLSWRKTSGLMALTSSMILTSGHITTKTNTWSLRRSWLNLEMAWLSSFSLPIPNLCALQFENVSWFFWAIECGTASGKHWNLSSSNEKRFLTCLQLSWAWCNGMRVRL